MTNKPSVGDTVHVRAVIVDILRVDTAILGYYAQTPGKSVAFAVNADEIIHIEPRPLAVGDLVKASNSDSEMRVIAIDDDEAFIRSKTSGRSYIEKLDTLTRCP